MSQLMLNDRQDKLLGFIIRKYVQTAQPVSSALACQKAGLDISPATVRSEMNDLEERGFLAQLHTSGGRVPTDRAYRYFVNNLLADDVFKLDVRHQHQIQEAIIRSGQDPRQINKAVATVLSSLSEGLVIAGIDQNQDFYKVGLATLFEMPEFRGLDRVFQMTSFFEEFDRIYIDVERQLFQPQRARVEFNIMIGRENPFSQIKDEAVMVAKYPLPANCVGSRALIGPTRMDYEKNISLIKYMTEELERQLT